MAIVETEVVAILVATAAAAAVEVVTVTVVVVVVLLAVVVVSLAEELLACVTGVPGPISTNNASNGMISAASSRPFRISPVGHARFFYSDTVRGGGGDNFRVNFSDLKIYV